MKNLFLKLFNKKEYWTRQMEELIKERQELREELEHAIKYHRERHTIRVQYKLISNKLEQAYPKYLRAIGKV